MKRNFYNRIDIAAAMQHQKYINSIALDRDGKVIIGIYILN